jgi:peptide/nickel transport system substrate-binding protein
MYSRSIRIVLTAATFVVLLFSINTQEIVAQDDDTNVLRVGLRKLTTIDPALGANDPEVMFSQLQYDYLIDIDADGELVPSLSTDWTVSDDGLTYTFNLREGVTFEDGSSFGAEDVVYTFNRLVTVGSSIVSLLGQEQVGEDDEGNAILEPTWSVEAVDGLSVRFTLDAPNADFLFGVASRFSMIVSEGAEDVNQVAEGDDPYVNFNGTGPFILTNYQPEQNATYVANENYWLEGAPALDGIELVFFDGDQGLLGALQSGVVDYIIKIPENLQDQLDDFEDITVTRKPTNTHAVIRVRTDEGSLGEDVRVRQALKFAIDRELLNLDALNGAGVVGNNDPIGPSYGPFYSEQENRGFDPEAACALLAEVLADGTGNGYVVDVDGQARVEVTFYVGDTFEYPLVAEFAQQQWREGCIDVELNVVPENVYYADGANNWLNAQLGMTAWGDRPTPQEYLNVAYTTGAPFNEANWSNEQIDALAAQAATVSDIDERAALYDEISGIFLEAGPIIIPYFRPVVGAYDATIEGLVMHTFPGRTNFRTVSFGG